jgi:hypothetical protein
VRRQPARPGRSQIAADQSRAAVPGCRGVAGQRSAIVADGAERDTGADRQEGGDVRCGGVGEVDDVGTGRHGGAGRVEAGCDGHQGWSDLPPFAGRGCQHGPGHGTILLVSLVLLLAAAVILGGVVAVAMGYGGEIGLFGRDLPERPMRLQTPFDVVTLALPTGLFGYQEQATRDALRAIARLLAERDTEIAGLRDEVRQLTAPIGADEQ